MAHGNGLQWIYKTPAHLELFKAILRDTVRKYKVRIHAVVLMRNHYHMLLETPEGNLIRTMHKLDSGFAQIFNRTSKRKGTLFNGRYKSILVEKEEYYLTLIRYISQNPKRIGIVERCEEYAGSYMNWIRRDRKIEEYLYIEDIRRHFGGSRKWYDKMLEWVNEGKERDPQDGAKYRYLLGSEEWVEGMRERLEGGIRKRTHEKRKYYKSLINEAKLKERLKGLTKKEQKDIRLKIYADYSGYTLEELSKKLNIRSEAACWQRLYRFRKELGKNRRNNRMYRQIEIEVINC